MLPDEEFLEREIEVNLGIRANVSVAREGAGAAELTSGEMDQVAQLAGGPRRDSWLRGRKALKSLLARLGEPPDTAGIRFPNPRFSLSHSGDFAVAVAVAVAEKAAPSAHGLAGIGVDLEVGRVPARRGATFFLTEAECLHVDQLGPAEQPEALLRLWTVKEALYKANPENQTTWFTHYAVEAPGLHTGNAVVAIPKRRLRFTSLPVPSGYLSFAICLETTQA
jgi:4'-phosphopantetheinyl transferase EntD